MLIVICEDDRRFLLKLTKEVPGLRDELFDGAVRAMKYRSFVTASQRRGPVPPHVQSSTPRPDGHMALRRQSAGAGVHAATPPTVVPGKLAPAGLRPLLHVIDADRSPAADCVDELSPVSP
ncbi:hypothetical protein [Streptomyces hydrogenans]